MRTILFRLLGHQAYVGHTTHRFRIEGAVLFTEINRLLINFGVGTVWNNRLRILKLVVFVPHLP